MDDLERELGLLEDLEDDNDFSDDNSTKERKKTKLPLVNHMCAGMYLHALFCLQSNNLLEVDLYIV